MCFKSVLLTPSLFLYSLLLILIPGILTSPSAAKLCTGTIMHTSTVSIIHTAHFFIITDSSAICSFFCFMLPYFILFVNHFSFPYRKDMAFPEQLW